LEEARRKAEELSIANSESMKNETLKAELVDACQKTIDNRMKYRARIKELELQLTQYEEYEEENEQL
ncbi:hypothetical protein PENTCL1PPCAC_21, partial [Pristionchus entomophagus]